jgi:hypothetical protein
MRLFCPVLGTKQSAGIFVKKMLLADFCKKLMRDLDLEPTPLRVAFVTKYEALLCLRSFSRPDSRSLVAATEVLTNFSRNPDKQERYYRAVIKNLDKLIAKANKRDAYRLRDVTDQCWDSPGHVGQVICTRTYIRTPVALPRARYFFLTGRLAHIN